MFTRVDGGMRLNMRGEFRASVRENIHSLFLARRMVSTVRRVRGTVHALRAAAISLIDVQTFSTQLMIGTNHGRTRLPSALGSE